MKLLTTEQVTKEVRRLQIECGGAAYSYAHAKGVTYYGRDYHRFEHVKSEGRRKFWQQTLSGGKKVEGNE